MNNISYSSQAIGEVSKQINYTKNLSEETMFRFTFVPLAIFAVAESALALISTAYSFVASTQESYDEKCAWLNSSLFSVKWSLKSLFKSYSRYIATTENTQRELDAKAKVLDVKM